LTVREAADIDEATLTYAEIKAITSANPLIKRKHEVELELGNLQVLESQYRKNRYNLQDKILKNLPDSVARTAKRIAECEKDIALRDENTTEEFVMTIAGKPYTERKDAAEILHKLVCSSANTDKVIAVYKGFEIIPNPLVMLTDRTVTVRGNGDYTVSVSESAAGTLTRLDHFFERLEDVLKAGREKLQTYMAESGAAKAELDKPFEHAQAIADLTLELEKINAELNLDKKETEIVIDDTKFQNEVKAESGGDGDESGDEGEVAAAVMSPIREIERGSEYEIG
jgi:hypothetical protein